MTPRENQDSFKLGDKREDRIVFAKVRLFQDNHIEEKRTYVEKVHTSPNFSLLRVDEELYPIEHPDGPDFWQTERKYTDTESVALPVVVVYSIIMTYLNIQDYFQTSVNFDISEFFIAFATLGMGIWVIILMRQKQILVIELQPKMNAYVPVKYRDHDPIVVNRTIKEHHGYRAGHVMAGFIGGGVFFVIMASNSLEFLINSWPFITTPRHLLGWMIIGVYAIILIATHAGMERDKKKLRKTDRLVFVSALLWNEEKEKFEVMENYTSKFSNTHKRFESILSVVNDEEEFITEKPEIGEEEE